MLGLSFFIALMVGITIQYIPYNSDVAFLRIKQDYIDVPYYLPAFYVHVYTSMFVLLAGFTQFSKRILRSNKSVHKFSGRFYAIVVLFLSAPSGFLIGLHANGGWASRVSFCLLAILWLYFTVIAVVKIRQGKVLSHKAFMYRSYALALSAITLRLWKYLIVFAFHPHPMDVYRFVAWFGWVPNLLLAEYLIFKLKKT